MRRCGPCTLCCCLTKVPELRKPEFKVCRHCGPRCRIYETRPASCAKYKCAWLLGDLGEEDRPDLIETIVERLPNTDKTVICLTHGQLTPISRSVLDYYISRGVAVAARGRRVFVPVGRTEDSIYRDLWDAACLMGV